MKFLSLPEVNIALPSTYHLFHHHSKPEFGNPQISSLQDFSQLWWGSAEINKAFIQLLPIAFMLFSTFVCDDLKQNKSLKDHGCKSKAKLCHCNALESAFMWKSLVHQKMFLPFFPRFCLSTVCAPQDPSVSAIKKLREA